MCVCVCVCFSKKEEVMSRYGRERAMELRMPLHAVLLPLAQHCKLSFCSEAAPNLRHPLLLPDRVS